MPKQAILSLFKKCKTLNKKFQVAETAVENGESTSQNGEEEKSQENGEKSRPNSAKSTQNEVQNVLIQNHDFRLTLRALKNCGKYDPLNCPIINEPSVNSKLLLRLDKIRFFVYFSGITLIQYMDWKSYSQ